MPPEIDTGIARDGDSRPANPVASRPARSPRPARSTGPVLTPPPPPPAIYDDSWQELDEAGGWRNEIIQDNPENDPKNKDKSRIEFDRQTRANMAFYVTRSKWTNDDEKEFARFVQQMGRAVASKKCNTVKSCFQSREANIYADQDAPGSSFYADCADFPYLLRAYFAYHNHLPFSHVVQVKMNSAPVVSDNDRDGDLPNRKTFNSPYGNSVVRRGNSNVARKRGGEPNIFKYLSNMYDTVSTSTLRVSPFSANYDLADFYPVKIDQQGVGPGAIVHSTGHAMVVWNVDSKGTVQVIDAHPDGSLTFKQIGSSTLERTRPEQALGFFRFRPLELVGATQGSNGALYGGKTIPESDESLIRRDLFSMEQWFGPSEGVVRGMSVDKRAWKKAFRSPGFFDFLAARMRGQSVVVRADEVIRDKLVSLCEQLQQRVGDVARAAQAGVPQRQHPSTLPNDIFGEAEAVIWGPFSTPGRDGRLRAMTSEIIKSAVNQFRIAKAGGQGLVFDGSAEDFVRTLRERLGEVERQCSVRYVNSAGSKVSLSFQTVLGRLNRLSFDPYHCPEKRWGASGEELKTCRDGDPGGEWYKAQQFIRNTIGKTNDNESYVVRSDRPITIAMLLDPKLIDQPDSAPINLGTRTPPLMNLDAAFASPQFLEQLRK